MTERADLETRLYGMMQHLLAAFANGVEPETPAERQVVDQRDALDAVIQLSAAIDQLTQQGPLPVQRGKWIASLLMVLREYVQPLPPGLSEDGMQDLLTPDLQEMVAALREARALGRAAAVENVTEEDAARAVHWVTDANELLEGGDSEHRLQASAIEGTHLDQVAAALDLLSFVLTRVSDTLFEHPFPNDLGAFACFTRTFRDLRGATLLTLRGYHGQARALLRGAYEAAGLGRLLAKDPELAEKWLRKEHWIPDREVRAYIKTQTLPDDDGSPYQEFYKLASAWAHPSARSTVPLVLEPDGSVHPKLMTRFDPDAVETMLREIAAEAVFACFALQRALVDIEVLPATWRQRLAELATEVMGHEMPHLNRDWDAEQRRFEAMQAHVLPADQLEDHLRTHPNSWDNVRSRMRHDTADVEPDDDTGPGPHASADH